MFEPRKTWSYDPAFETMSMGRRSISPVSGTACIQWTAAWGGIGSAKVASFLQAAATRAIGTTQRSENRSRVIATLTREGLMEFIGRSGAEDPGRYRRSPQAPADCATR